MQQVLTEAARLIRTLENTEEAKRWCFQGFIKVLFPMTLRAGCAHWCSPLEKQALLHMAQWRSRERTKRGQLSVVKEGSRAKIRENLGENIQCDLPRNGYGSGRLIYQKVTEQMEGIHLLQSISFFVQGNAHTTLLSHSAPSFYSSRKNLTHDLSLGDFIFKRHNLSTYSKQQVG